MMLSLFTNLHVTGLHPVQHLDEDELAKKINEKSIITLSFICVATSLHLNMYYDAKTQEAVEKALFSVRSLYV